MILRGILEDAELGVSALGQLKFWVEFVPSNKETFKLKIPIPTTMYRRFRWYNSHKYPIFTSLWESASFEPLYIILRHIDWAEKRNRKKFRGVRTLRFTAWGRYSKAEWDHFVT